MDREQIAQELADAHELLSRASMARLAYNGLDGLPRVVPIGIYWTGEEIVMSTAATAPKVRALTARPEVALTVDTGDSPGSARSLSVRGVVHLTLVDGVVPEYLAAARKNFDAEQAAEFERNCRAMYDRMARIAVEPRWARFYDFGAGRVPRFLAELAEHAEKSG
ncbi:MULTISPECIES: pyridoxamine 5'-phosphate oxidase family protein [Streptomyces]|uniref:Pyridoxamine 5'-phosphate oxidase-related FMN-binding protein n=1 Tax=Streptomyces albus (strain ATCC 21838 / DSM 41398 / FERM P-419 / JCM 4703 / NBRC 107858) TaxID=1081613 RepID=A0A0B5F030_STRA4|nr:pyridoxamine 5'-phosphate oxidase family protein [Streptomyces sp. SCSIO ZS0520]AJE83687.1 pyridoxamine 5'-phosphate oxidase-related FMN-binding protein [Streptomyces albus]AOU77995.1 pyridoxamine 5'-phosphate oxidase-related FMN-binding protein [Streptomyces albus]AYN33751.1 pyridoxamine 5'-phosphate oxidase [Streptomyces albus]